MTGRPSDINKIIGHRDVNGTQVPVTVAEQIIAAIRAGNYIEGAAAAAGITKQTVYEWRHVAARTRIAGTPDADLTDHQRRCITFSDAVDEAEGIWEVNANRTLERIARGGIEQEVVTVKTDHRGNVVERTTRTTSTLPDARVIEWRLKRRFRDRYAERVEVTGADGDPLGVELSMDERAASLVELAARVRGADAPEEPPEPAEMPKPTMRATKSAAAPIQPTRAARSSSGRKPAAKKASKRPTAIQRRKQQRREDDD